MDRADRAVLDTDHQLGCAVGVGEGAGCIFRFN